MFAEDNYNQWKSDVNNHPEVVSRKEILTTKTSVVWGYIKDVILLILIASFIIVISMMVFYPENYQGIVQATHICDPVINTTLNTYDYSNFTCQCGNNICPQLNLTIVNIVNGS